MLLLKLGSKPPKLVKKIQIRSEDIDKMQAEFPRSGMHRGDSKNVGRRKTLELNWLKCPKIVPKNPEIWSRK